MPKGYYNVNAVELSWSIGHTKIYQIIELDDAGEIIQESITGAAPEEIMKIEWLVPNFADSEGNLKAHVQSFLIQDSGKNIIVDTCNGNGKERTDIQDWGKLQTNFLDKLRVLGVEPEDIDYVLCTHLHFDHVGWNTTLKGGAWVPTFPNARYLFAKEEFEYWKSNPEKEIDDDKQGILDSVMPVIDADLADLIEPNHKITKDVYLVPSPGHTPCHVSVMIESENKKALISGDFVHHPCQVRHPDWYTLADTYPDQGIETRKNLFKELAKDRVLLLGSHFSNPVSGHVVLDKDTYRFNIE